MRKDKIKINLNSVDEIRRFVQVVRRFDSNIDIMTNSQEFEAKSIMALFNLDLSKGAYVVINTDDYEEYKKFVNDMEEFK